MAVPFRDVIADPPANLAEWETAIFQDHGLQTRWPKVLRRMYRAHKRKIPPITDQIQDMVDYPDIYIKPYVESGMTRIEAKAAALADLGKLRTKKKRMITIVKCCRVELEIRALLIAAGRHPVEPDDGKPLEPAIPVEAKTITAIDPTTSRSPVS